MNDKVSCINHEEDHHDEDNKKDKYRTNLPHVYISNIYYHLSLIAFLISIVQSSVFLLSYLSLYEVILCIFLARRFLYSLSVPASSIFVLFHLFNLSAGLVIRSAHFAYASFQKLLQIY